MVLRNGIAELSDVELLLALIDEKSRNKEYLQEKDFPKILDGGLKCKEPPFGQIKFSYTPDEDGRKELMYDIATLIGIGDIVERGEGYYPTMNGESNVKMIKEVIEATNVYEKAIHSSTAPI